MTIPLTWQPLFKDEDFCDLMKKVEDEREYYAIYPEKEDVFNAFHQTPLEKVKVVIVGQDPYHQPGQAEGLCFSVPDGMRLPPSLRNIYKEIEADLGAVPPKSGSLLNWAKQGVLLLNTLLTVREGEPLAHKGLGWERFTDKILEGVLGKKEQVVFLLWGRFAKDKVFRLKSSAQAEHLYLTAPHPSPLSAHRGFLGCKHFSKCNQFLESIGKKPIRWVIN
jgi:uracil-DNA glycosylase